MQVEHDVVVFPIDEQLQAKIEAKAAEGWQLVPGFPPVALYHLMRNHPLLQTAVEAKLGIDDEKVMILRADGRLEKN